MTSNRNALLVVMSSKQLLENINNMKSDLWNVINNIIVSGSHRLSGQTVTTFILSLATANRPSASTFGCCFAPRSCPTQTCLRRLLTWLLQVKKANEKQIILRNQLTKALLLPRQVWTTCSQKTAITTYFGLKTFEGLDTRIPASCFWGEKKTWILVVLISRDYDYPKKFDQSFSNTQF